MTRRECDLRTPPEDRAARDRLLRPGDISFRGLASAAEARSLPSLRA